MASPKPEFSSCRLRAFIDLRHYTNFESIDCGSKPNLQSHRPYSRKTPLGRGVCMCKRQRLASAEAASDPRARWIVLDDFQKAISAASTVPWRRSSWESMSTKPAPAPPVLPAQHLFRARAVVVALAAARAEVQPPPEAQPAAVAVARFAPCAAAPCHWRPSAQSSCTCLLDIRHCIIEV